MATTPVPAFVAPPDFPALSDRATGTYNSKAYAWATAMQSTTGPNIHAIAVTAKDNADDAALSAVDAATQVGLAAGQVTLAQAQALEASDQADRAEGMADAAAANAAYKGDWASLSGALAVPATVTHSGDRYVLLSSIADVTAHQPGVSAVWQKLTVAQEKLVSGTNIKTVAGQSLLGSGDISVGFNITPMVLSANTTLTKADAAKSIDCTGSMTAITLPAASVAGNGWFVIVRNKRSGVAASGNVIVARSGSDTIDTLATMDVLPGLSYMIVCNGTGYVTTKLSGQGYLYVTSGTSWTCPAGVHQAKITVLGGGGGGGGGKTSGSKGSGGGQGGVGSSFVPLTPGTAYTIAIGAGGAAGTGGASPTDGASGGVTSFTHPVGGTANSYGGSSGLKGETSLTTVVWGGGPGLGGLMTSTNSIGMPAGSGGIAYGGVGAANGDYSPTYLVGGNYAGRGGSGGSPGGNGQPGAPGAIIIEY